MNMMDEYLDVMNRAIPADTNPAIVETVRGIDWQPYSNAKRENFDSTTFSRNHKNINHVFTLKDTSNL